MPLAEEKGPTPEISFFRQREEERAEPAPGLAAGKVVGEFRLVALIGQGGMGQVWEAEQLTLKRRVAVKFVRPERVTAKQLELFAREARAGGRLSHPGIVGVHEYGHADGLDWIAMEFIGGAWTLKDFLDDVARASETPRGYDRHVARFVAEVAEAMHTAHEAGVIHRDLKPQNILITADDHPKVTDFGLARITDETALSVTGDFAGTYFYMSPEQVTAKRIGIDHRSDVFSLGVVLYELLALRRPFEGDTTHQVAEQIVMQDPPDPRTIRSKVPRDLAVIAGKALEKSRDKRYQTMKELAADLRRYLADEPILARPPGRLERALKWVRRNPAKSSVAAVVLVALVVISALLVQNVRANLALGEKSRESEDRRIRAEGLASDVLRLSDLQDAEDLEHAADELWPARPALVTRCRDWIEQARRLVDKLPVHREKLAQLRSHALPRTEEERRAERESHPDWGKLVALEGELAFRRRALSERRDGTRAELPAVDWSAYPEGAAELNEVAWRMVEPERTTFGDEALALALAERAHERATSEKHVVGDTLAWALFALGRDEEALKASAQALADAPEASRAEFEGYLSKLERAVDEASSSEALGRAEAKIAELEKERDELDARVDVRRDWRFPEEHERWWENQLAKLITELETLEAGLLAPDSVTAEHGWSVPKRLAFAERLRAGFAPGGEHARAWDTVLPALRADHPGFLPELGLVPLDKDPRSDLWEFADLQTGVPPVRDAAGELVIGEETGLVFVLLPGGSFLMGAQADDPAKPCYDPDMAPDEGPVHEVTLSPFFLSKYEMTQAQWERFAGTRPSQSGPANWTKDWNPGEITPSLTHPVEKVSWRECERLMQRLALSLPSEAQWEFAARGGTRDAWWFGDDASALATAGNIADQQGAKFLAKGLNFAPWDDGATVHLPVDAQDPNLFGFHGMLGNVLEWCADGYYGDAYRALPRRDPLAPPNSAGTRARRGGAYSSPYTDSRSANRGNDSQDTAVGECGLRPARALDPR
jgi:serine/threonine protein kinase/formylglycine-generating enzyme required for sulfatase activity